MYFQVDLCCLCLNCLNKEYVSLCETSDRNISYYQKLISSFPQLILNDKTDDYKLCMQCCDAVNITYDFSNKCIRNINIFREYRIALKSSNRKKCALNINLPKMCVDDSTIQKLTSVIDSKLHDCDKISTSSYFDKEYDDTLYLDNNRLSEIKSDDDASNHEIYYTATDINVILEYSDNDDDNKLFHNEVCDVSTDSDTTKKENKVIGMPVQSDITKNNPSGSRITIDENDTQNVYSNFNGVLNRYLDKTSNVAEDRRENRHKLKETDEQGSIRNATPLDMCTKRSGLKYMPNTYSPSHTAEERHTSEFCNDVESASSEAKESAHTSEKTNRCITFNNSFMLKNLLAKRGETTSSYQANQLFHTSDESNACTTFKSIPTNPAEMTADELSHTSNKSNVCDESNNSFILNSILANPEPTQMSYLCNICARNCKSMATLEKHKQTHNMEKRHVCNICNKGFVASNSLKIHMRIHTGEKPYVCDVCQHRFRQNFNLVEHMRIHTGEKPYQCDICDKRFCQSSHLTTHKRTHTGEKPYHCDVCNKSYNTLAYLRQHKNMHTGLKPYACPMCDKKFSRKSNWFQHKLTHR